MGEQNLSEIMEYTQLRLSSKDLSDIYDGIEFYICQRYGILTLTEVTVLRKILKKIEDEYERNTDEPVSIHSYGHRNAGRKPVYPDENTAVILRLHEQGLPIRAIAQQAGCSSGRVQYVIQKHKDISDPHPLTSKRESFWLWFDRTIMTSRQV